MAEQPPASRSPNRYVEALKDEYHLLGWCGLIVGTLMADQPLALFVLGPTLEAAYLAWVPNSGWFRRRLEQRRQEMEQRARAYRIAGMLPQVARRHRERYLELTRVRQELGRGGEGLLARHHHAVLDQLDYLIERFLVFATKSRTLRTHLARLAEGPRRLLDENVEVESLDLDHLTQRAVARFERDLEETSLALEQETDAESLAILRKNAEILRRSRTSVEEMARLVRNLERQMALVENTFTLLHTQATRGVPDRVLEDVTMLVNQSDALAQTIQEFAPVEQALIRLGVGRSS